MTSTSESQGFTLIELLVALVLSAILLLCLGPVWAGLESKSCGLADRLVWALQAKVAGARLERDLRAACTGDASDEVDEPPRLLLEAGENRVVFRARPAGQTEVELIAWDINEGRLMRRRGMARSGGPVPPGGWVFFDNKTMLESLAPGSRFSYFSGARELPGPLSAESLRTVDRVELHGWVSTDRELGTELPLLCWSEIGR